MFLGSFWPSYSVNRAVKSTSKLENKNNDQFLTLHIIVILYWRKRCCHSLVPLLSWRWHIPARQCAPAHHARQTITVSYCNEKLRSSSVRTYGRTIAQILILLIIAYGAWCKIVCKPNRHHLRRGWSETMLGWHLEWLLAKHCGWCRWWMA